MQFRIVFSWIIVRRRVDYGHLSYPSQSVRTFKLMNLPALENQKSENQFGQSPSGVGAHFFADHFQSMNMDDACRWPRVQKNPFISSQIADNIISPDITIR